MGSPHTHCPTGYLAVKRACGHQQAIALRCKSPLCPSCERERSLRVQRRWTATLKALPEVKLLTLTIQNGDDLKERLNILDTAFRGFMDFRIGRNNRKLIRNLVADKIAELVAAAKIDTETATRWQESTDKWLHMVTRHEKRQREKRDDDSYTPKLRSLIKGLSSLEITYAPLTKWHAHRHLIISTPYMPQIVLSEIWEHVSGSVGQIVDIRAITDVETGIHEALKYVTKGWEIPAEPDEGKDLSPAEELLEALHGKKRTWVLGRIKPQPEEPKPCPDCNSKECTCRKVAIIDEQAHKLDDGSYLVPSGGVVPIRIKISRDEKGRLTWERMETSPSDLSLYRPWYQEKGAQRGALEPPRRRRRSDDDLTITLPGKPEIKITKTAAAEKPAQLVMVEV